MREKVKIGIAIGGALIISFIVTKTVFLPGTPKADPQFIASLPSKTGAFITKVTRMFVIPKQSPTPMLPTGEPFPSSLTPSPTSSPGIPTPTLIPGQPTYTPTPSPTPTTFFPTPTAPSQPTATPTRTATLTPTRTATPTPTRPPSAGCPTTSSQTYHEQGVGMSDPNKLGPGLEASPDVNIVRRGWTQVNESPTLISRNGDNYGLDPVMPPQISSLYGGSVPQIIKTYRVYEWDWVNNKSAAPQTASPNYPVHMLGLAGTPGQPLVGLRAGRQIDSEGDVFITLYATNNYILFSHSADDNLFDGYLFYFVEICVDPNLLATYQKDNAEGRVRLPAIHPGQTFGYVPASGEVKYVIRDTMSFMDTRYKEDWWFYGQ